MNYSIKNILQYYNKIKNLGINAAQRNRYVDCIVHFDNAAILAEKLNWIYKDDDIENYLLQISEKLINKNLNYYSPISDRYIFYDHIGKKEVLSVQYYRALMSWNVEFLYILEPSQYTQLDYIKFLKQEFENYPKASLVILPTEKNELLESIQNTYNLIRSYRADKVFFHLPAEASHSVVLWGSLPEVKRYRIVPGDHHFYIGVSITDYAIEFRDFGLSISVQKRGFNKNQLLYQPYYPVIFNKGNFEGFPQIYEKEQIILFAGGSVYKTFLNKRIFYTIVKYILDNYANAVLLYAGKGDFREMQRFIDENDYSKRFILLGFRTDIYEVMKNCDIYLYSYGGLMSQYAALCKKPIIALNPNGEIDCGHSIEGILNYGINGKQKVAYSSLFSLNKYIDKLMTDKNFRKEQGEKLSTRIISPEKFNESLYSLIHTKPNCLKINFLPESCLEKYMQETIEQQNNYLKSTYRSFLVRAYKIKSLLYFPKVFLDAGWSKFSSFCSVFKLKNYLYL